MSKENKPAAKEPKPNAICIDCKNPIQAGAKVCTHCSSHQDGWLRWVSRWSPTVLLGSAFIGVFAYVLSSVLQMERELFWQDKVRISALDTSRSMVVQNSGDGTVFMSHLNIFSSGFRQVISLNRLIEARDFALIDFESDQPENKRNFRIEALDDATWQTVAAKPFATPPSSCWSWHFYTPGDPNLETLRSSFAQARAEFRYKEVDASLTYRSAKDGRAITDEFKLLAVPARREKYCAGKS